MSGSLQRRDLDQQHIFYCSDGHKRSSSNRTINEVSLLPHPVDRQAYHRGTTLGRAFAV